jgi:hypothetical protein
MRDNKNFGVVPEFVTLTKTYNNSDMSTLGVDDEASSDDDDDYNSADSVDTVRLKIKNLRDKSKKRKQAITNLREQLKDSKQARKGRVATKRKITRVRDLASENTMPLDKQVSLNNYFRETVFHRLKLVTKEVLKSGVIVNKIMKHLMFVTEHDKNMYRAHVEIALQTKIGQYRDNSVRNIKWKYRTKRGKGPSK